MASLPDIPKCGFTIKVQQTFYKKEHTVDTLRLASVKQTKVLSMYIQAYFRGVGKTSLETPNLLKL